MIKQGTMSTSQTRINRAQVSAANDQSHPLGWLFDLMLDTDDGEPELFGESCDGRPVVDWGMPLWW